MRLSCVLLGLLIAATSYADNPSEVKASDTTSEAKAHYEKASAHFALGEFAAAAEEYQAAYRLRQDPALLYNAAQSFRLAGNNERALLLYRNYLQFFPDAQNADEVRTQIEKLKVAVASAQTAKSAPPLATQKADTLQSSRPSSNIVSQPTAQTDRRPAPVYKRWWFWTAIGGALVIGGAVAGIVIATRPAPWQNEPSFGPGTGQAIIQW